MKIYKTGIAAKDFTITQNINELAISAGKQLECKSDNKYYSCLQIAGDVSELLHFQYLKNVLDKIDNTAFSEKIIPSEKPSLFKKWKQIFRK